MPEYVNPHPYSVHLAGPHGDVVRVDSGQKIVLDQYFDKYRVRGFLRFATRNSATIKKKPPPQHHHLRQPKRLYPQQDKRVGRVTGRNIIKNRSRQVVGSQAPQVDPSALLAGILQNNSYPISNGIGVGILSHNRLGSLKRLVTSICQFTDLDKTTVFISDDGSSDPDLLEYLKGLDRRICVLSGQPNLGIAGNSNRLLRCLSRFTYGLLLNDDVEVLRHGWEKFYQLASDKSGIHHFQHRQPGVYGGTTGQLEVHQGVRLRKVIDKPQGAVLAFTHKMLVDCGYFDERYGRYGMEHVDWSLKSAELQLQPAGFFDVEGSEKYFRVYPEQSSLEDRQVLLRAAREVYSNRQPGLCLEPSPRSAVPAVTYVVPFREQERSDSLATVIANIRAQKFPQIEIILVEQDSQQRIELDKLGPIRYFLAKAAQEPFNKSMAFNLGVYKSTHQKIVLHDADMLIVADYTNKIYQHLKQHESCHIGKNVIYTTPQAATQVNRDRAVKLPIACDNVVGYFEGGSLACDKTAYWRIGGFNEDFWGYGVEDCDFYARLSQGTMWLDDRTENLLHLWHPRTDGWNKHHERNKELGHSLRLLPVAKRIELQHQQLRKNGYLG